MGNRNLSELRSLTTQRVPCYHDCMETKKDGRGHVSLPGDAVHLLREEAHRQRRSMSQMAAIMIEDYIAAGEEALKAKP